MNREASIIELRKLYANGNLAEARNLCLDLARRYPNDLEMWKARADLHFQLSEYDSFGECVEHILSHAASPASSLINTYHLLGVMCAKARRVKDAIKVFEHLIAVDPGHAEAHTCKAMAHLLLGDLPAGWSEYEWRLKTERMALPPTGKPRWDGQPLDGKTILIIAEQGYGDAVQFVRYVGAVKNRGGTVILACRPALNRLLTECVEVDRVVNFGDPTPPHDVHVPLLSLPCLFRTTLDTIPADVPYLKIPQNSGMQAVTAIARHTGVRRVGLVWAGNKKVDAGRSLSLKQLGNLLDVPGVKFFSLQKDDVAAELKSVPEDAITNLGPYLEDFADTAAAIQAMDLVISVDTAVAHVAGAQAKPTWTLIPFDSDWRWMLDRDDTPWYPTMRLFRQPTPGDWSSVIARLTIQLTALVQQPLETRPEIRSSPKNGFSAN